MISVVIPCYNAAETLEATIESALCQDVDKEIIIVNDGSSDGTRDIIERYAGLVFGITTENRGVSAARSAGTSLAKGNFIQYLDSDDMLVPGTLAKRLAALRESGEDVAHTDWQKFTCQVEGEIERTEIITANVTALTEDPEVATATSGFWAPPVALLYRRRTIEQLSWHSRLPIIQDARFLFDAVMSGARFAYVPGVGALYRVSENSLSRSNKDRFFDDCAVNALEIEAIWRQLGPIDGNRGAALAEMWRQVALGRLMHGLVGFSAARQHYSRFGNANFRIELGRTARLLVGRKRAKKMFEIARSVKTLITS